MTRLQKMCITTFVILLSYLPLVAQQDSMKTLPTMNWSRAHNTDIKHIALDLQFDWKKKQVQGVASISFTLFHAAEKISLDAGMLTINSIRIKDGADLSYNYDGSDKDDALQISLDRIYKTGEEITIQINYHSNYVNEVDPNNLGGSNGKGLRFSMPSTSDPLKPREIWSIGESQSNRYWFPCYDAPNDLRTTEFTAKVDRHLTFISNGELLSKTENNDSSVTYHYKTTIPYANHLTSFVVGEFSDIPQQYNRVHLHNYGHPKEQAYVKASTVLLPDMMDYFSRKIGVAYPYSSYAQIFVQDMGSFTSNNGIAAITENMVDDYPTHADYYYLWDLTEAEALAQQWFGNYICAGDWRDAWLNKSLAHYMNALYNEQKNGKEEFLIWQLNFDQSTYLYDWSSGNRRPVSTAVYDDVHEMVNDNYTTVRGALVLHMLRKYLGDEIWWKAIHYYVADNAGKLVSTEDFRKAVEKAGGEPMDWFFDQWIYKMGHPVFEITKQYDKNKNQLRLLIKQTQTIDSTSSFPQTQFFKGKLVIETDKILEEVWVDDKAENIVTFNLDKAPLWINVDVENTWIKELHFEKSFEEYMQELQYSKDILAQQAALLELMDRVKNNKLTASQQAQVKNVCCLLARGNTYWRLRLAAVTQLNYFISPSATDTIVIAALLNIIKNESSWLKAGAIRVLGNTKNIKYADVYFNAMNDSSERVVAAAALALAKTKSKNVFEALEKLCRKPSMKSQQLLSAFAAFKELGDKRAVKIILNALLDVNLPRWRLPVAPVWDYRITAAETLAALGKGSAAYKPILERFKTSMQENDVNGIFNNALIIAALADARGRTVFDMLHAKYEDNPNALQAVTQIEIQYKNAMQAVPSNK